MKSDRIFFPLIAFWFIILATLGFSPTFKNSVESSQVPGSVKIHGFVFIIWLLLFFLQTILIRLKKVKIHTLLGRISGLFAIAMVVSGLWVAFQATPENGGGMLGQQIKIISLFACFFILGMVNRKNSPQHKRYMTFATISIMSPAVFRIQFLGINDSPVFIFAVLMIPSIALLVYDWFSMKKINKATIVGITVSLGVSLVMGLFYKTDIWKGFVKGVIEGF